MFSRVRRRVSKSFHQLPPATASHNITCTPIMNDDLLGPSVGSESKDHVHLFFSQVNKLSRQLPLNGYIAKINVLHLPHLPPVCTATLAHPPCCLYKRWLSICVSNDHYYFNNNNGHRLDVSRFPALSIPPVPPPPVVHIGNILDGAFWGLQFGDDNTAQEGQYSATQLIVVLLLVVVCEHVPGRPNEVSVEILVAKRASGQEGNKVHT